MNPLAVLAKVAVALALLPGADAYMAVTEPTAVPQVSEVSSVHNGEQSHSISARQTGTTNPPCKFFNSDPNVVIPPQCASVPFGSQCSGSGVMTCAVGSLVDPVYRNQVCVCVCVCIIWFGSQVRAGTCMCAPFPFPLPPRPSPPPRRKLPLPRSHALTTPT